MLRNPLTIELSGISDKESDEYERVLKKVQLKIEEMVSNELRHNSELREGLMRLYGLKYRPDQFWVRVANWWEHDNIAIKLDKEQVWLVD